jgi:hypothetical protein
MILMAKNASLSVEGNASFFSRIFILRGEKGRDSLSLFDRELTACPLFSYCHKRK